MGAMRRGVPHIKGAAKILARPEEDFLVQQLSPQPLPGVGQQRHITLDVPLELVGWMEIDDQSLHFGWVVHMFSARDRLSFPNSEGAVEHGVAVDVHCRL